jgi:hypothetical protein
LGYLPCPDIDTDPDTKPDGIAKSTCGSRGDSVVGCFPWKTLGVGKLLDASGNELWYAISGSYKGGSTKNILTSDTNGLFVIENRVGDILNGSTGNNRAIAVIFSVGSTVSGQNRNPLTTLCNSNNSDEYLENDNSGSNASGINNATGSKASSSILPTSLTSTFLHNSPIYDTSGDIIFNDALSWITPEDFTPVYKAMDRWVAEHIRGCLEAYSSVYVTAGGTDNRYPWLDEIDDINLLSDVYDDDDSVRFGRISTILDATQSDNVLMPNWIDVLDPDPAFQNNDVSTCFEDSRGFNLRDESWDWWHLGWKEQVFVVVNSANTPPITNTIDSGLRVAEFDDNGWNIDTIHLAEFVVIVAGRQITPENAPPSIPSPTPTPPLYYHKSPFGNNFLFDYEDVTDADLIDEQRILNIDKSNINNYLDTANEKAFIPSNTEIFAARSNFEADTVCDHTACY